MWTEITDWIRAAIPYFLSGAAIATPSTLAWASARTRAKQLSTDLTLARAGVLLAARDNLNDALTQSDLELVAVRKQLAAAGGLPQLADDEVFAETVAQEMGVHTDSVTRLCRGPFAMVARKVVHPDSGRLRWALNAAVRTTEQYRKAQG